MLTQNLTLILRQSRKFWLAKWVFGYIILSLPLLPGISFFCETYPLDTNQVTSPVQWESTVKTLMERGLKKSFELGPGKVHKTLKFFPLFLLNYASDFFYS